MARKFFSEDEIEVLWSNPYTLKVNRTTISFTDDFKHQYKRRLLLGHVCTKIFKDLGYDLKMLGTRRVYSFDTRFKENMRLEAVSEELDTEEIVIDPEAQIARLENEVTYLRQELEFVKKIIKSVNTKK